MQMFSMEKGFYVATAAVVLWGLMDAVSRVVVGTGVVNPLVFTLLNFVYGSAMLLALSGFGKEGLSTLKDPYTWVYGFFRVIHLALFNVSLLAITATEAAFITRVSALFGVVLVFFAFGRKPEKKDAIGLGVLGMGALAMAATQPNGGLLNWAVWLVLGAAFLNALLLVIVEAHPVAKSSRSHRSRSRYTAITLMVTSLFFFGLATLLGVLSKFGLSPEWLESAVIAPKISDLYNLKAHMVSAVVGALIIGPVMYLTFWAVKLLKSDNMLLAGSLIPFATIAFESVFSLIGLTDTTNVEARDILFGLLITVGSVYTIISRIIADAVKQTPKDWVEEELEEIKELEAARKRRGEKVTKIG
jgi:drug/metabolite transporter (DMT)-like permease